MIVKFNRSINKLLKINFDRFSTTLAEALIRVKYVPSTRN